MLFGSEPPSLCRNKTKCMLFRWSPRMLISWLLMWHTQSRYMWLRGRCASRNAYPGLGFLDEWWYKRGDSLPSADVTKETRGGCGWQGLLGWLGPAPGCFAKGQVKSRSCVCLEGGFFLIIPKSWMGEWDPGLELRWPEWMEKGIAGSFTDKHPIVSMPSSPVCIVSFQSIFPPVFFSQWFLSFISALMFGPSLTINLAGTALKGPKRKPKHTTRSLDTIDTAICQAPRASGRDVLQCSSGQLVDCGTLIITLLKPEHQPLYEPSDITYGWNEVRRGQKKTRDELAMTAVQAALEMPLTALESEQHFLLERRFCPPGSLLLWCFNPTASFPGKATLLEEDAGKASKHCFWNVESINLTFLLV